MRPLRIRDCVSVDPWTKLLTLARTCEQTHGRASGFQRTPVASGGIEVTKFVVNRGHDDERVIEADLYFQQNGFFYFRDDEGDVASVRETRVETIDRLE